MRPDIAMVFDQRGNALDGFEYTADELERRALQLRRLNGEITTVTIEPSPFVVFFSSDSYWSTRLSR